MRAPKQPATASPAPPGAPSRIRGWALWTVGRTLLAYLLVVEVLAGVLTFVLLSEQHESGHDVTRFVCVLGAAVVYTELGDRVERIKRYLGSGGLWPNVTSAWAVAGMLVLSTGMAMLLVACIYLHLLIVGNRHKSVRPHRMVLTGAAMLLATALGSWVTVSATGGNQLFGTFSVDVRSVVAVLVFHAVDLLLVLAAVYLASRPPSVRDLLPGRSMVCFELATQAIGLITAQLVVNSLWLAPAAVFMLAMLHRASLVGELQEAATIDVKTGLLNAASWRSRAEPALRSKAAERGCGALLIVDLDHFKLVNDLYGHLVGDQVLQAVSASLRRHGRSHDIIGRFGGEEFVVLLGGAVTRDHAVAAAELIRSRITELELPSRIKLTGSIGVGWAGGRYDLELDELLQAADTALYRAKGEGRNCVRTHSIEDVDQPWAAPAGPRVTSA